MKRALFLFSFPIFLFACRSPGNNHLKEDSIGRALRDSLIEAYSDEGEYYENLSCEDLRDQKVIFHFAEEHAFGSIASFDTSETLVLKGHFIDNKSEQTLVWTRDYPMPSCGDGCNLVMLFSCDGVARMIFSTTAGVFKKEDVRDLDNDGVLEIVATSDICRMGECHSHYDIFNFKDTAQHFLYKAYSFSYLDETWGDNYEGYFKKGDTIDIAITSNLVDQGNGIFNVKQVRTVKTFDGGKTIEEIRENLVTRVDSSFVSLKKLK